VRMSVKGLGAGNGIGTRDFDHGNCPRSAVPLEFKWRAPRREAHMRSTNHNIRTLGAKEKHAALALGMSASGRPRKRGQAETFLENLSGSRTRFRRDDQDSSILSGITFYGRDAVIVDHVNEPFTHVIGVAHFNSLEFGTTQRPSFHEQTTPPALLREPELKMLAPFNTPLQLLV
jgi:hypothetical protein